MQRDITLCTFCRIYFACVLVLKMAQIQFFSREKCRPQLLTCTNNHVWYVQLPLLIGCSFGNSWQYCQTSNISSTKSHHINVLVSSCSYLCPMYWSQLLSQEWRCSKAAPTSDAPTTTEWWTILLPTKGQLIFEIWRLYQLPAEGT